MTAKTGWSTAHFKASVGLLQGCPPAWSELKGPFLRAGCSVRKEPYGTHGMDFQQHQVQCFMIWRVNEGILAREGQYIWCFVKKYKTYKNRTILDQINMHIPFKSICECVALDVSCLGAGPGPGRAGSHLGKGKTGVLASVHGRCYISILCPPQTSDLTPLISADGLASDVSKKTGDTK